VRLVFSTRAWEDYLHWRTNSPQVLSRLNDLVKECRRTPFKGTGKPEPLRGDFNGWCSRRVTLENRLVYRVSEMGGAQQLEITMCRFHH
jgi:toxin YoeB